MDAILKRFVRKRVNSKAHGTYSLPHDLYGDDEAVQITHGEAPDEQQLSEAIRTFIPSAFREYRTEYAEARNADDTQNMERWQNAMRRLINPESLARTYFARMRSQSLNDAILPKPKMMRNAAQSALESPLNKDNVGGWVLCALSLKDAEQLKEIFSNYRGTEFSLSLSGINTQEGLFLAAALAQSTTLTTLSLGHCQIGDAGTKALNKGLLNNYNILHISNDSAIKTLENHCAQNRNAAKAWVEWLRSHDPSELDAEHCESLRLRRNAVKEIANEQKCAEEIASKLDALPPGTRVQGDRAELARLWPPEANLTAA